MKILLAAINAKYIHSNLAIYDLQAYVKDLPAEVVLGEYTINQLREDILKKIYLQKADVVAFSCYIWNITMVMQIAEELHKISPQTRIWLGGPEASYDASGLLLQYPFVDLVMVGEGECTFYDLIDKHLFHGETLANIPGITYRSGEGINENALRPYMDMDEIPFVYEDMSAFAHKIIYYETSRGCPFQCSYCLSSIDKRVRFRSLSLVFRELDMFLQNQVPQVKFVDRTFNCVHDHAYAIWKYILEHDNGVTNFHFEVSSDLLRPEDFALFAQMRPGLIQLEIGVQSTNSETISEIKRTMNLDRVKEAVDAVKKMKNIHQHLDLIAGLPYETLDIFKQSFNDVYAMQPEQLQLGFLKVLKGSYMEAHKEEYGLQFTSLPPYEVLCTKWLSYEDVLLLKGVEEMVEVYYNSGQFINSLAYCIDQFKDAFTFFYELSVYYEKQGLFDKKHTRLARYDILRAFMLQNSIHLQLLEECLLYDLYITENSKKRPQWAHDWNEEKMLLSQIRNPHYRKEHLSEDEDRQLSAILKNRTDLHLEKFSHLHMEGQVFDLPCYVLFDYQTRNPLTNQVATCCLHFCG